MKHRKKITVVLSVILGAALVTGIVATAVTDFGSQSDPLVTLSYINDVVKEQMKNNVNTILEARVVELRSELDSKITELETAYRETGEVAERSTYKVVSLSRGQTLTGYVGTEFLLRVGSANVVSGTPGLIDTTGGITLDAGGLL